MLGGIDGCRRLGDPLAGLNAAIGLGNSFLGLWGFISEKSDTLGKAIEAATTYKTLHADTLNVEAHCSPGHLELIISPYFESIEAEAHAADFYLLQLVRLIQQCTGEAHGIIASVHFKHPAPEPQNLILSMQEAFKLPIHFSASNNKILIYTSVLSLPLVTADPELQAALKVLAHNQLTNLAITNEAFLPKAQQHLKKLLYAQQATKSNLAKSMGISTSSLARQMQANGITYRDLIKEVRLSLAKKYLSQPSISIAHIAQHMSFNDPQSFSRWFFSVAGQSPTSYRKLVLLEPSTQQPQAQ